MAEEEPPPFRVVQSATGPGSLLRAPVVIACDHASARVPTELESLGLPAAELARHIAVDIGAGEVTLRLAKRLGCPAVLCNTSRLVVDCNRHPDEPAAIVAESDGTHIPGNQHLSAAERRRRIEDFHQPYHDAVRAEIDALLAAEDTPGVLLLNLHSMTPQLTSEAELRPWHISVLSRHDRRVADPLIARLAAEPELAGAVGDNEPYSLRTIRAHTLAEHAQPRGLPHVAVEIRQDLITDADGQDRFAALLAQALLDTLQDIPAKTLFAPFDGPRD